MFPGFLVPVSLTPSLRSTSLSLIIYYPGALLPESVIRPPRYAPLSSSLRALRAARGLSSTGLPPVLYTRIQIFLDHGIRPSRPLLFTIRPDNEYENASNPFGGSPLSLQKKQRESYESVKGKSTNSFGTMNCRGQGFRVFFSEKTLGVSIYHASFGSGVDRECVECE